MKLLKQAHKQESKTLRIVKSRAVTKENSTLSSVRYTYKKLKIYHNGSYFFLPIQSIQFIKADGSYTLIRMEDNKSYFISKTLKQITNQINHHHFIRCHNSYLVNENHIEYLDHKKGIILIAEQIIPISRSHRNKTLSRLQNLRQIVKACK